MNRITLSSCDKFVEVWNNGNRVHMFHIDGMLADVTGRAREWVRKWTGDENPEISKELKIKLNASDSTFQRLAFGGGW